MARFYVGQRVRIIYRGKNYLREATITGLNVNLHHLYDRGLRGIEVDLPHHIWPCNCVYEPHELEPLADPGREVVSWDACAWKPEHLRDKVS